MAILMIQTTIELTHGKASIYKLIKRQNVLLKEKVMYISQTSENHVCVTGSTEKVLPSTRAGEL